MTSMILQILYKYIMRLLSLLFGIIGGATGVYLFRGIFIRWNDIKYETTTYMIIVLSISCLGMALFMFYRGIFFDPDVDANPLHQRVISCFSIVFHTFILLFHVHYLYFFDVLEMLSEYISFNSFVLQVVFGGIVGILAFYEENSLRKIISIVLALSAIIPYGIMLIMG